jgi:hypothetical protein
MLGVFGVVLAVGTGGAQAQTPTHAELAARLSGTWKLNRELSPGFKAAPARGRGAGPGAAARFAVAAGVPQGRGGRGGGASGSTISDASDLTPAERASQAAMQQLQGISEEITIRATAESVTFIDPRGERTYPINDRTVKIDVNGAEISTKSKWDRDTLRQEFSNGKTKLTRRWEIDQNDRLVLGARLESLTLNTVEQKAVFDRQQ